MATPLTHVSMKLLIVIRSCFVALAVDLWISIELFSLTKPYFVCILSTPAQFHKKITLHSLPNQVSIESN